MVEESSVAQEQTSKQTKFEPICLAKEDVVHKGRVPSLPPKVSLKTLPPWLKYVYLDVDYRSPVIVSSEPDDSSSEKLLVLLRKY